MLEPRTLYFHFPDAGNPAKKHRIACYQWGNPHAARTAVCAHGLTRNGRDFDRLALGLVERGYRVFCPDIAGRGQSEWLSDRAGYNYPAYLADMLAFVRLLGLTQVDWIGTSMGGILGMMMAGAAPGVLRSLVLNDIGCVVSAIGLKRIANYNATPPFFPTRAAAEVALRERCAPFGIIDETQWAQLFAHSFQETPQGVRFACDPAVAAGLSTAAEVTDRDLWSLWEPVTTIPVLLIRGAESDLLLRDTATAMQEKHPRLTYHEIKNAGHAPALMDQQQIALITDWLASL